MAEVCGVEGCGKEAVRSLSINKVREAGLDAKPSGRRIYLCKEHYKEYKKRRKKLDRLERMRWKHV